MTNRADLYGVQRDCAYALGSKCLHMSKNCFQFLSILLASRFFSALQRWLCRLRGELASLELALRSP
jgi:hypothetical protein